MSSHLLKDAIISVRYWHLLLMQSCIVFLLFFLGGGVFPPRGAMLAWTASLDNRWLQCWVSRWWGGVKRSCHCVFGFMWRAGWLSCLSDEGIRAVTWLFLTLWFECAQVAGWLWPRWRLAVGTPGHQCSSPGYLFRWHAPIDPFSKMVSLIGWMEKSFSFFIFLHNSKSIKRNIKLTHLKVE